MSYLTFNDLKQRSGILKKAFKSIDLSESISFTTSVFLSHRHTDSDQVKEIIGWLHEFNAHVYIDVYDYSMPDKTSDLTAKRIKEKIIESSKFILLATPNSLDSRWIPWELGLGDAFKGLTNVAILPLLYYDYSWPEREYYQIYGNIQKSDKGNWCYFLPGKNGIRLERWLTNNI